MVEQQIIWALGAMEQVTKGTDMEHKNVFCEQMVVTYSHVLPTGLGLGAYLGGAAGKYGGKFSFIKVYVLIFVLMCHVLNCNSVK